MTIDYSDAVDYSRFSLMTILLRECLMLAKRGGLQSLLLTTHIITGRFLCRRCGRSVFAVISVISVITRHQCNHSDLRSHSHRSHPRQQKQDPSFDETEDFPCD